MNFLILGGAKRSETLYDRLIENGYNADYITIFEALDRNKSYDCIILPIPTLTREKTLNFGADKKMLADEFLHSLSGRSLIVSCNYENPNFNIVDLNKREDFTYLNAIPTAEGAIAIAIGASDKSLSLSDIAITGFGHVGKILAEKLQGLGCNTTIIARSDRDIYLAKALGYKTKLIADLKDHVSDYDIIFQTIPSIILNSHILDAMNKDTKIIELSSRASGTDMEYANKVGIKVINAPALPEKTAPITAGNILYDCVINILNEQK